MRPQAGAVGRGDRRKTIEFLRWLVVGYLYFTDFSSVFWRSWELEKSNKLAHSKGMCLVWMCAQRAHVCAARVTMAPGHQGT